MNNKTLIIGIVMALLLVTACARRDYVPSQQQTSGQEQTTENSLEILDADITEIDKLTQDLDTEDLDTLDEELNEVENADI